VVDVEREADRRQLRHDLVDLRLGHVGDDEVLQACDPHVAADPLGEVGDGDHLVAGDETEVDGNADVDEAGLLLFPHAEVIRRRSGGRRQREGLEPSPQARLDPLAHPVRADVVDHEFEACLHP
jgi:hypothetical protein